MIDLENAKNSNILKEFKLVLKVMKIISINSSGEDGKMEEKIENVNIEYLKSLEGRKKLLSYYASTNESKIRLLKIMNIYSKDLSKEEISTRIDKLNFDQLNIATKRFFHSHGSFYYLHTPNPIDCKSDEIKNTLDDLIVQITKNKRITFIEKFEDDNDIMLIFLHQTKSKSFYLNNGIPQYITPSKYIILKFYHDLKIVEIRTNHPKSIIKLLSNKIPFPKPLILHKGHLNELARNNIFGSANFSCEGGIIQEQAMKPAQNIDLSTVKQFQEFMERDDYQIRKLRVHVNLSDKESISSTIYPSEGKITFRTVSGEKKLKGVAQLLSNLITGLPLLGGVTDSKKFTPIDDFF